jgi:hypothetical protein
MKIQEIDLDKYYRRLLEIGLIINYRYPNVKSRLERLTMLDYRLFAREQILRGNKEKSKWQTYFKEQLEQCLKEEEGLREVVDRYDFDKKIMLLGRENGNVYKLKKEGAFIGYFFPDGREIKEIDFFRKNSFAFEKARFDNDFKISPIKSKDLFIEEVLKGVSFKYMAFYEQGEPVQMGVLDEPREIVLMNFANDLGIYDFIQEITGQNIKSVPVVKKRQRNDTIDKYQECVKYYRRQLSVFNGNEKKAEEETLKKYKISLKTFQRALKKDRQIRQL